MGPGGPLAIVEYKYLNFNSSKNIDKICSTAQIIVLSGASWGWEIIGDGSGIKFPLCSVCLGVKLRVFLVLDYDFPQLDGRFNNFILMPPNAKFSISGILMAPLTPKFS